MSTGTNFKEEKNRTKHGKKGKKKIKVCPLQEGIEKLNFYLVFSWVCPLGQTCNLRNKTVYVFSSISI